MWLNLKSNTHLSNIISNALIQRYMYVHQDTYAVLTSYFLPLHNLSIYFTINILNGEFKLFVLQKVAHFH